MGKAKNIHFMGIGGSGIGGVASLSEKMGYEITGCDIEEKTAYTKHTYKGHNPEHLDGVDLMVVSPAIYYQNKNNPELISGEEKGIVMTWQEFLGKVLLKRKKVIAIAGTHGKSTTTAMTGKLLIDAGFDPIVVVGAQVPEWGGNSRYGKGAWAVIEADEFNNNFLNYHPDIAVINNIEFDHPDFFDNKKEVEKSFNKFIKNIKKGGTLITEKDSPGMYFNLKIFGKHNQKNANMVYMLGRKLGIKDEAIIESLESFEGISRRMELIAERNGVKIYDDYAHHPTAIKTTLKGLRDKYPNAKIMAIIEPHGYKRTKALLSEYKEVFNNVNKVIIGPIFKARDKIDTSITPQKVANASNHKNILAFDSFEKLFVSCKLEIENCNYQIIVVMGAGKSYLWAKEIADLIPVTFKDLTTFKIGGQIENYIEVKRKQEVSEIIKKIKKSGKKMFILGGGSDILANDKKFNGTVIKFTGNELKFEGERVIAEAGVIWDRFVEKAVMNNLQGVEKLSGIPGTVGASPIQNIGAYGQEVSQTIESLEVFDIDKEKFVIFKNKDCKFGYRESVFKTKKSWQKYLIVKVTFKLKKNTDKNSDLNKIRNETIKIRNEKLEDPEKIGNAGSFFKNPIVEKKVLDLIKKKHPDVLYFPFEDKYKIPAAWLIEKAGWKGKSLGNAGVSPKHALIVINRTGKAGAKEIYDLSEKIINDVKERFGIALEREVQLINF